MMGSLNLREHNRRQYLGRASWPLTCSCLWSQARCQSRPTASEMDQEVQAEGKSEKGLQLPRQGMSGRVPTLMNPLYTSMDNLLPPAPPDRSQQLTDTVLRDTYPVPECRVRVAEEPMFSVSMRSHATEPAQSKPAIHMYTVHCPKVPLSIIPLTSRESHRLVLCHEPVAKQKLSRCFAVPSSESCRETVERPNRTQTS
jgi:hypothetical protein